MQIEIKLDPSCTEPKVTVTAAAMDETVRQIVDRLQEAPPQVLTGLREDKWQVLAPEEVGITLSVQVKAKDGWDSTQVCTGVKNTLQTWFSGERLAQDVLLAQLGSLIYGCEGVVNYKIVSPAADVAIDADQLPVLSSINVEAMT